MGRITPGGMAARIASTWARTQAGDAPSVSGEGAAAACTRKSGGPGGGGGCQGRAKIEPAAGRESIVPVVFGGGGGG